MTDLVQRATAYTPNVLTNEQLQYISGTEFVPGALRGNMPAILACVATGRALGIDDMTALRSINMIDGKASFSAELLVMLVRRAGHSITGDVAENAARAIGKRADTGDEMSATFTIQMAERAGLLGKQNWKKYPESMLWARAVSQLCRMLFADCFAGATYTTEELGEEDTTCAEAVPELPPLDVDKDVRFPPVDEQGEIVPAGTPPVISDAQRRRLRAIQKDAGVTDDRLRELVVEVAGVESTKLIPQALYDALVEAVAAEVFTAGEFTVPVRGGGDGERQA